MAQQVEHVLGKDEVTGSNPVSSSIKKETTQVVSFFYAICYLIRTGDRVRLGFAQQNGRGAQR